ncbi:MAG TPA: PQQ-binding-like beta-propeller repeat protein [Polyangiaceae bacterium]|jgi:outer membrane protein assembly factor BamB
MATGCRTPPALHDEPTLAGVTELQGRDYEPVVTPAVPLCTSDAWTTYAHDGARTSASGGCLSGPLHVAWRFAPRCTGGCTPYATHAIGDTGSAFVSGALGPTPALWRVDVQTGKAEWAFNSGAECVRGGWPTLAANKVVLVDDGVSMADVATGAGHRTELDAWGESVTDGEHVFAENDWYLDGYGLSMSAFELDGHLLWRRDYNALARGVQVPDVGGLAIADGVLVHAAQHGPLTGSGLSAFDPRTSARLWRVPISPQSSPSIDDGRVFAVEHWRGEPADRLVARSLDAGVLLWARELPDARGPAPVLADGLVIEHTRDAVVAFDAESGAEVWTTALPRTLDAVQSATTLAAALGSGTLVVVSRAAIHLLRLADGSEVWSGAPVAHAMHVEGPAIVGSALYVVADGAVVRLEGSGAR